MARFSICALAAVAVGASWMTVARAQQRAPTPAPAAPARAPAATAPAAQQSQPAVPPPEVLVALIRSTVIAVNQANLTNNYAVLRDLGAPGFKSAQTHDTLSRSFEGFRKANIDASITAAVTPQLSKPPSIDEKGLLRVTGFYPTQPRVLFDIAFQQIGHRWYHEGIAMGTANAPQTAQAPVAQPAPAPATSPIATGSVAPAPKKK